ncbi:adenylate kinase [Duncaniella muris]|uniref:Adenylate kinase n=1 Tax=Duncaniella muris TaxID=2094150 RepID=A0A2V1ISL6_9BACT|nr:adenylate kinase [Duncaniella muris]PWB04151.1 adenylate kinase [Duncaniella muris]
MFNLVIFGAPGSGKGTQSEKLIDRYGLTHISTGDVLRKEIAAGSELGKIADSYISKGQLIPDELMVDILASEFDRLRPESKGFIFDGFPRTIPQAEALKKMLEDRGEEVHSVIGLEVADEELMERLIKRGAESGRSDDNPETIGNRLKVYHSTTSPLRDYYTAEGTYRAIQGSGRVDEIFSRITEAIESQTVLN